MNIKNLSFLFLLFNLALSAQDTIPVWENGAPNKNNPPGEEIFCFERGTYRYRNVSKAELFVYHPAEANNTGAAVIICPGGGYWIEQIRKEGTNIASYLQSQGITGIVLKYRLPYGQAEVPTSDVARAIRLVRSNADQWGLDPDKIGIAGASAGGHLAAYASVHNDGGDSLASDVVEQMSSRPDFTLLLYPVVSFREDVGNATCRQRFIGKTNDWEVAKHYSAELWITENTPPAFIVLSDDDFGIKQDNSILYYQGLKKHNVPGELHIFAKGGHGYGLKEGYDFRAARWHEMFVAWLYEMEIIK